MTRRRLARAWADYHCFVSDNRNDLGSLARKAVRSLEPLLLASAIGLSLLASIAPASFSPSHSLGARKRRRRALLGS
jgi:hypothetical protein